MKRNILFFSIIICLLFSCKKIFEIPKNTPALDCNNPNVRDSLDLIDKGIIHKYILDSSLIVDSTATGLYYQVTDSGIGNYPLMNSFIKVNYKGYLINGRIFDQTTRSIPVQFSLNQSILGWQYGIPLIKKGGKIKLIIPSALGYGCQNVGAIPANSVIIFDVELVDFR